MTVNICVVFTIAMSILERYPRRWLESIQRSYFIGGHKDGRSGRALVVIVFSVLTLSRCQRPAFSPSPPCSAPHASPVPPPTCSAPQASPVPPPTCNAPQRSYFIGGHKDGCSGRALVVIGSSVLTLSRCQRPQGSHQQQPVGNPFYLRTPPFRGGLNPLHVQEREEWGSIPRPPPPVTLPNLLQCSCPLQSTPNLLLCPPPPL